MTEKPESDVASLERLLESGDLPLEILHPGGLELTRELAELCGVGAGKRVLDVASGSGEAACFLVETFSCEVVGVDASEFMVERARDKAAIRRLEIKFLPADAHALPLDDDAFDAVLSECTTCVLDKQQAIREMVRVCRAGGHVGIHDLCWRDDSPEDLKRRLADLEGERPETLDGWKRLFEEAGLTDVVTRDKSGLLADWTRETKRQLGLMGQVKAYWKILRRWGFSGLRRIQQSEKVFQSDQLGYGLIVGTKR